LKFSFTEKPFAPWAYMGIAPTLIVEAFIVETFIVDGSLAFANVPLLMLVAFAAKLVALVYAVAALPVTQEAMLANVPLEFPRNPAAFAVSVATFAESVEFN
jgi:hypothetical protein